MKPILMWAAGIFAAVISPASAQPAGHAGALEKLALIDAKSAKPWTAVESSCALTGGSGVDAAPIWRWWVDVDHHAGEPKYPIGWPRLVHALPAGPRRDWSGWEFLRLRILVETSRPALPPDPAGLGLHVPDRANSHQRPLRELRKDEWVEIDLPISQIPRAHDVRQIQFHISEANYRHGDRIDFHLGELALVRHAAPTLAGITPDTGVLFSDARRLPVRFELLGAKPGEKVAVDCALLQAGRPVAEASHAAVRGANRVLLELPAGALREGAGEVRVRLGPDNDGLRAAVRVVASPWEVKP